MTVMNGLLKNTERGDKGCIVMDERLKGIKRRNEDDCLFREDIDYLIQQAEEKESYKQNYNRVMSDVVRVGRERDNYYYQNQRYKEALEEIQEYVSSTSFNESYWDVLVIDTFINKALEGKS